MHVRMLCLGRHWNGKAYAYEPTRSDYDDLPAPPLPASFRAAAESIAREEFIVAIDVDDRDREARIQLAVPLARSDLLEHFASQLFRGDELAWDERTEAVVARRVIRLGELLIEEKPLNDVPREAATAAMLDGVRSGSRPCPGMTIRVISSHARNSCANWPAAT
jgi:hypothetical protein